MDKYIGVSCPVCSKPFEESDDVVVCPDCGAPHHRACYKELGRCAFTEQHTPDGVWKNPNDTTAAVPRQGEARCPQCGVQGEASGAYCRSCGARLDGSRESSAPAPNYQGCFPPNGSAPPVMNAQQEERAKQFGIGLEDKIDGVSVKEVAQFVGENSLYYLPRFKLFDTKQPFFTVNLSAMITGFFFYFHRKMYKLGAALLGAFLIMIIPQLLLYFRTFPEWLAYLTIQGAPQPLVGADSTLSLIAEVTQYLYFMACPVSAMFANKLYFRFSMEAVHRLKEEYRGRPENEYAQALSIGGRTNKILVVGLVVALVVAINVYFGFLLAYYHML